MNISNWASWMGDVPSNCVHDSSWLCYMCNCFVDSTCFVGDFSHTHMLWRHMSSASCMCVYIYNFDRLNGDCIEGDELYSNMTQIGFEFFFSRPPFAGLENGQIEPSIAPKIHKSNIHMDRYTIRKL